ncbi:MAG: ABC transporter ATP-binding protein [Methylomonas sp.]|jgi:NitT/TauT family transport system ATP-binding protein
MSSIHIDIDKKAFYTEKGIYTAIADLKLEIASNEFVCLVGPSGCGKTTLLNIVAGLDQHFEGGIGMERAGHDARIGYVFQNPRLLPWCTLRRNIELVFHAPPPAALIDSLLSAMQLEEAQHLFPGQLSLGMQRRAAIIRAFAVNPDVLLLDEPFVSLDAPTARLIRNLLYSLWLERPHTILFVTHDLREAITLADRLIFLNTAPMQIAADIPVTLDRNERCEEAKIEAFRGRLLNHHPEINALL